MRQRFARTLGALAAVSLLALGCSPVVVWYGHSPDRRRRVEVLESLAGQSVRLDDSEGADFRGVAVETVTFSADGARLAYAAESELGWHLVVDGRPSRAWDGIGEVAFSPDGGSIAYAAANRAGWRIVLDGVPGPTFDAVLADTLSFSRSSTHLAYAAQARDGVVAVLDGRAGGRHDGIARLGFAGPDGPLAYVARNEAHSFVVVDGVAGEPFDAIGEVAFAAGHVAYTALREPSWVAVVDRAIQPAFERVDALRLAADGRHFAYVARRGHEQLVVHDGVPEGPYRFVDRGSLRFAPDGRLAYAASPAHAGAPEAAARHAEMQMWLDGAAGPSFERLGPPVFAAEGRRWGYVGERSARAFVVIDGQPSSPHRWANDLSFSADGAHFAYLARQARHPIVVHDGRHTAVPDAVDGSLVLDRSGRHWAALAAIRSAGLLYLVVDGRPRHPFDMGELVAALSLAPPEELMTGRLDAAFVRGWVAAELELALAERRERAPDDP